MVSLRRIIAITLALFFVFGCDGPERKLYDAKRALDDKNVDEAIGQLEKLVAQDYAPAKLALADLLNVSLSDSFAKIEGDKGLTVEKDYPRAKSLLKEVIEQGGTPTSVLMARTLECESGPFERDYDEIIRWRELSGKDVRKAFAMAYAEELSTGLFASQDLNRAEEIFEYYAKFGFYYATEGLVTLLQRQDLDKKQARKLYKWASLLKQQRTEELDKRISEIQQTLSVEQKEEAENLIASRAVEFESDYRTQFKEPLGGWQPPAFGNSEETLNFLREESIKKNPLAQNYLANLYLTCMIRGVVDYDNQELFEALTNAANAGYPESQYLLSLLLHGENWPSVGDTETILLAAAEKGSIDAQDLVSASYIDSPLFVIRPPLPPDPVEAYFWTHTLRSNYVDKLNNSIELASSFLTEEEKDEITSNVINWKPRDFPGYPLVFDTWPSALKVAGTLLSAIAALVLIYLSTITFRAGAKNTKNLAVTSILILEALVLITLLMPQGLPANLLIQEIASTTISSLGPIVILMCTSYFILAGQFVTPITRTLNTVRAQQIILALGLIGAAALPFLIDKFFGFGFKENSVGLEANLRFPNALYLTSLILITHIFTLGNLVYFFRLADSESKERRQAKAFLLAYIVRFGLLGTAIALFLGVVLYYRDSGGNPPEYTTIIVILYALGELLFGLFFSLGILREQIFGIEQLFKRNLIRIVLFGFLTVGFLSAEQLIENFVSDEYGTLGGLIVAIGMLSLHKPFTRIVKEQIDRLLPDSDIIDDDASKVYAHQFELAMQDGILSSRERDMLRLTAKSLGLTKSQATAIEQQFATS